MSGYTATPWRNACFQVYGADNSRIAHTGMGQLPPSRASESEANAAFIVTACNSHAELVKLEESFSAVDEQDWAHLFRFIPDSGHGKFWKAVFMETRAALATLTARKVG